MERKLPKNIRQIGNVSDNPKIYVEDYVDTFFIQLEEKAKETTLGAFLIGETFRVDDQDYMFISGAIQMQGLEWKGKDGVISDKTWKKGCEECKQYFAGSTIVGWMLVGQDLPLELNGNLIKMHEKTFMRKNRVLVMRNVGEKEEVYYVYKYNDLMKISGHYIYYEKNPSMQDYMISKRKQNCVTPSEDYEDRATKDFRSIIREKDNGSSKRRAKSSRYAMNVAMVLLLVVVGVYVTKEEGWNEKETNLTGNGLMSNSLTEMASDKSANQEKIEEVLSEFDTGEKMQVSEEEVGKAEAQKNTEAEEEVEEEVELNEEDGEESQGDEGVEVEQAATVYQSGEFYEVVEGDTLAKISIYIYGTMGKVEDICEANGLTDSDYIYIGQKLLLP